LFEVKEMSKRLRLLIFFLLLLLFGRPAAGWAEAERTDGGYFTVAAPDGSVLLLTGIVVNIGDQFVANDDNRYTIVRIEGDIAYTELSGSISRSGAEADSPAFAPAAAPSQAPPRVIGIYHTHSGESYRPSEGKILVEGRGGVYGVGATIQSVLSEYGIKTLHSDTIHNPSGSASMYIQSRRTAAQLIRDGVDALFDIHRDTAPAREYAKTVEGKEVARVLLVLGRQNPSLKANEELVFKFRDKLNELYPGLLRGIFYARGLYNQDLSPQTFLVEVGTAGNSREEAEAGAALFATTIPAVLYGLPHNPAELKAAAAEPPPPAGTPPEPGASGAVKAIAWLLTLTILGSIFFLALNEGSWSAVKTRLALLKNLEFTNYLGRKLRGRGREKTPAGPDNKKK
jgi:stage II sporulation protein P